MDQTTEDMIEARGMTAPHVTKQCLQDEIIKAEYHRFEGTTVTVCCLYLKNGFTVIGHSACADASNYDPEIGRRLAREHATEQMWPLLGFRLRDQLDAAAKSIPVEVMVDPSPEVTAAWSPNAVEAVGSIPCKPVELGDQVLFFERVGEKVSDPMLATVAVVNGNRVSVSVLAADGSAHGRPNVALFYPWEEVPSDLLRFCRPK